MRTRFALPKLLALAVAFLIGCLGNDSGGGGNVTGTQFRGTWFGTFGDSAQGGDIYVRAAGDSLDFVYLSFTTPACANPVVLGIPRNIAISSEDFSATLVSGTDSFSVSGTFSPDSTTVSGTVTVLSSRCGTSSPLAFSAVFQSSDASLANLSLDRGTLSPAFAPGILTYTVTFLDTNLQVRVLATTSKKFSRVTVNGVPAASGSYSNIIHLSPGNNSIPVVVRAQDSATSQTYTITVTLAPYPAPPPPVLLSPADTASGQSTAPTLSWNAVTGAASYTLQVSPAAFPASFDEGFESGNFTGWIQGGNANWVAARDSRFEGAYAAKSGALSNSQTSVLQVTRSVSAGEIAFYRKVSSENGGDSLRFYIDGTPVSSWSGEQTWTEVRFPVTAGSHVFRWEYSKNGTVSAGSDAAWIDAINFSTPSLQSNLTLTGISRVLSGLTAGVRYHWRVLASNAYRNGPWSAPWSFTTLPLPPPGAPTLQAPVDGATGQPLSVSLTWNAALYASSYTLQVAADSFFTSLIVIDTGLTGTSRVVGGLAQGTRHYWRVIAVNSFGTANSQTWTFTTGAPPAVPTLVSPADNATGIAASPTLSWNAVAGSVGYRLQVSTDSAFLTSAFDSAGLSGTSRVVTGLSVLTTYYWRVMAANAVGSSAWSARRRFTTAATPPPPAPILRSPASGAGGQSISLTLTWNSSAGATSYTLQLDTDTSFNAPLSSAPSDTAQLITGLTDGTTYYWRVAATNANGTGAWSTVWNFTTVLLSPPPTPILLSPANGTIGQPTSPTLTWNSSAGALSYIVQLDTDTLFTPPITSFNPTGTSQSCSSLTAGTRYYWRVYATNANGNSAWSTVWNFTIVILSPPPAPILLSPANGTTGQPTSSTLSWNSSPGALSYFVLLDTDTLFTTPIASSNPAGTSQLFSGLTAGTRYYWRVYATNANGNSAWSTVWNFTTAGVVLPAPTLLFPSNGATGWGTSDYLDWDSSGGATSYNLQVSTNSTFSTTVINDTGIVDLYYFYTSLAAGTTYYWRVSATNANGTSAWSTVWNFTTTTAGGPPATPILSLPVNGSMGVPATPTLVWNTANGADYYYVQVSTDPSFNPIFLEFEDFLSSTSTVATGLTGNTLYYWRVQSQNFLGDTSAWSTVWNFTTTTAGGPPATPILSLPINGSMGVSATPTLVWNTANGADFYIVQVSTNPSFNLASIAFEDFLSSTSTAATGLVGNTLYYWRVQSQNILGDTSTWSQVWAFTIGSVLPPSTPIPMSPANATTNNPTSLWFLWDSASATSDTYRLQVSTDFSFATTARDTTLSGQYAYLGGLTPGIQYYWRVNASNGSGTSAWSTVRSFITAIGNPTPQVIFTSPSNLTVNVTTGRFIYFIFNTNMDSASTLAAVSINPPLLNDTVAFMRNMVTTGDGVMLRGLSGLSTNTLYTITVAATAQSQAGVPMSAPYSFSFTTGSAPPPPQAPASAGKSFLSNR